MLASTDESTRHKNPEEHHHHPHRRENLKSQLIISFQGDVSVPLSSKLELISEACFLLFAYFINYIN
jgi:hypothetical protein